MKKILIILVVILFAEANITAQLSLEAIVGGGRNMTLIDNAFLPKSPYYSIDAYDHSPGYNIEGGLGVRLFLLERSWSLGLAFAYQRKQHSYGRSPFEKNFPPFHCFLMPLDLNYNLKNGIGFHLGAELMLQSVNKNGYSLGVIQKNPIINLLGGVSYTFKRFRLELLYKHGLINYTRYDFLSQVPNQAGILTQSIYLRYHDIELRLAVRLYEWKNL